jgi:hypothetical protein
MYHIKLEDRQYIEEFKKCPIGHHSPGLQRILNLFRGEAMADKYVLICTKPHKEWMLGQLTGVRGERIRMTNQVFTSIDRMTNQVFTSIDEAEWFVFKQRWAKYVNETLPD